MTETDNHPCPPSEPREPRVLEWDENLRCRGGQFFEWTLVGGTTLGIRGNFGGQVGTIGIAHDVKDRRALAQALQDVLDGEPRESECPTNHTNPEGVLWSDWTLEMPINKSWGPALHCPDCGASLKGTQ
jgi:hypothetical protein